jgi:hypothetical protein
VVDRWLGDFAERRVPVRLFARTETLGEPFEAYRERVGRGERPRSAAYELATAAGRDFLLGDQVSYYVAGRTATVAVADHARPAASWDPARPDENTAYYQAKVLEVWERFRRFAEREGLRPPSDEDPSPQLSLF